MVYPAVRENDGRHSTQKTQKKRAKKKAEVETSAF
jgi:hypothetical protein